MKIKIIGFTLFAAVAANCVSAQTNNVPVASKPKFHEIDVNGISGFQDTPMEPDGRWHVHDPARTQPPVVTPGTFSRQAAPPSDAIVLFDGKDLALWADSQGNPAPWVIQDGAAITTKTDIFTKQKFGDIQLHLEFREPLPATGYGQNRGNSGIFFMGCYEIQVLDCFDNKTFGDPWSGAKYIKQKDDKKVSGIQNHAATKDIPKTLPRVAGHLKEWVDACAGGSTTFSSFEVGGHLTEIALSGVVALRTQKTLEWNGEKMNAKNAPEAQQFIQPHYRSGWSI